MITIEQMVQREVLCCMSSLVSTLAQGAHWFDRARARHHGDSLETQQLCIQASELAAPVLDYEEAATQEGWLRGGSGEWFNERFDGPTAACIDNSDVYESARECCEAEGIDPYEWEVYEHWAVTQWFAEQLQAQGERVDVDFAGLNIWARTTTGQTISMDSMVQKIYREMMK